MAELRSWPIVWAEPTEQAQVWLRRFAWSAPGAAPGAHYHSAEEYVREAPIVYDGDLGGQKLMAALDPGGEAGNPLWPVSCPCGYEFTIDDRWQVNQHQLYERADGVRTLIRRMAPGTAFDSAWWPRKRDGISLGVIVAEPDGARAFPWLVDSVASGCPIPFDAEHFCWCRHGDPRVPGELTVDKDCRTCEGGGGSILTPTFHGVVTAGVLREI